jgi:hypothetical protein
MVADGLADAGLVRLAAMGRRADPGKIDEAKRAGTRARLISTGMSEAAVDAGFADWEAHAAAEGLRRGRLDRDAAFEWITARRKRQP